MIPENDSAVNKHEARILQIYSELGIMAKSYLEDLQANLVNLLILIANVRDELGCEATFHNWCKEYLGWSDNKANYSLRTGRWIRKLSAVEPSLIGEIPPEISKIDDLTRIPVEHIQEFKALYPAAFGFLSTDRCEIRAWVKLFLVRKGLREPKPQETDGGQSDFFEELGLPPPEQFSQLLRDRRETLDIRRVATYGRELLSAALDLRASFGNEELKEMESTIYDLVLKVSKNKPKAFFDVMRTRNR